MQNIVAHFLWLTVYLQTLELSALVELDHGLEYLILVLVSSSVVLVFRFGLHLHHWFFV